MMFLLLLSLCTILVRSLEPSLSTVWQSEIDNSVTRNVKGKCMWASSSNLDMPEDYEEDFLVTPFLPTKSEVQTFFKLPNSLTKSHAAFLVGAHKKGYDAAWANQKQMRWEIPVDHPGQNRSNCYNLTVKLSMGDTLDLYSSPRSIDRAFYVARGTKAVIHPSGSIAKNCGYFQVQEGCETRWDRAGAWWQECQRQLGGAHLDWESLWDEQGKNIVARDLLRKCSTNPALSSHQLNVDKLFAPKAHKRVFVIAALWDFNYHHFIADSLARVSRNLKFLRTNTDVLLHIRAFEEYDIDPVRDAEFQKHAKRMRDGFFSLLGIDPVRVVSGLVVAEEVFVPRALHCSNALSNPAELRMLARELLVASNIKLHNREVGMTAARALKRKQRKQTMVIQQRHTLYGSSHRAWNDQTFLEVQSAFRKVFVDHEVVRMNSRDAQREDHCLACEIREYARASVLVGAHGAGLTAMMFMPPGSLVVEIVGDFKDVNMPVCGYYGPFAAIFGHHHYLYAYDHSADRQFDPFAAAREAFKFYTQLQQQWRNSTLLHKK